MATPSDDRARVAGVILAAGQSTRLGRPKQLLDIGGEPLVHRVTRAALESALDTVIVVVGGSADQVRAALADLDVAVVDNPDYASGQASSMKAGMRALPEDTDAVLFLLGDQPTVGPGVIDAVIERRRSSGAAVVQARYAGNVAGHPVLFGRSLFPELGQVTGDEGGRGLIRRRPEAVEYVDFDCAAPLDIDTEADYHRVLELLGYSPAT